MAFYNSYQGDQSSLKTIIDNIEKKSILIPGITCKAGIQVNELGDRCYYFKRAGSTITKAKAGKPINYRNVGVSREDFAMEDALQIGDIIPTVRANSSVDVVQDRLAYQALEAANMQNKLALQYLMAYGTDIQDYDDLTEDNAYNKLCEIIEDFKLNNKEKGLEPTAAFVSNSAIKLLLNDSRFVRFSVNAGDYSMYNNIIGKIGNCFIFEAPDMDDDEDFDFIVLHSEAFVCPLNVNSLSIKPAAQYGFPSGEIIAGELRYGFSIADAGAILVKKNKLSLKKPSIKFDDNYVTVIWAAVSGATGYIVDDNGTPQEEQTERAFDLEFATTEKYIAVKAVSDDPDHESEGPYSEKLFYQQRQTPVLSLYEEHPSVILFTDPETLDIHYDVFQGSTKVAEDLTHGYFDTATLHLDPGEYAFTVQANGFIDNNGKLWASSDMSEAITITVPEPEE